MKKLTPNDEYYYDIVKKFDISIDDFLEVLKGFNKYEDTYKRFIPYDVFDMIKISEEIKFDDALFDGLHLVLITSIIELLTTWTEYIPFDHWYKQNEEKYKNEKCTRAWNDYIVIHGKRKNFRSFFIDLKRDEKFDLLHMIKKKYKNHEEFRPFCYQGKKCDYSKFNCNYEAIKQNCLAYNDDKILNDGIKDLANHLYNFRSLFVHLARLPRFASDPPSYKEKQKDGLHIHLKSMAGYILKENNHYAFYVSELYIEDFFKLVMKNLIKMMKKYLNIVKQ